MARENPGTPGPDLKRVAVYVRAEERFGTRRGGVKPVGHSMGDLEGGDFPRNADPGWAQDPRTRSSTSSWS